MDNLGPLIFVMMVWHLIALAVLTSGDELSNWISGDKSYGIKFYLRLIFLFPVLSVVFLVALPFVLVVGLLSDKK